MVKFCENKVIKLDTVARIVKLKSNRMELIIGFFIFLHFIIVKNKTKPEIINKTPKICFNVVSL